MRTALTIALAAMLAFASVGCSKKGGGEKGGSGSSALLEPGKVLVKVNGQDITERDIDQQQKMIVQQLQGRVDSAQLAGMMPTVKGQAVENAINRLLLEQTMKKLGISSSKEQVDQRIADYRKNFVSEDAFEKDLAKSGLTKGTLRKEVEVGLAAEQLFNRRTANVKPPTEAEIRAFYDANKERFEHPEQVRASHILVKVNEGDTEEQRAQKKAKAEKILADLKKGADFAEQAKQNSDDTGNKDKGGDLGYFERGQMVPEFETAAFALKIGQLSGVVKSPFGYHIIKVTDRKKAEPVPFDQVKQNISMYLADQKKNEALAAYFDSLRAASKIEYMDSSLVR
jgi:peptidyl-prolyl cis-trans isomerase C